MFDNLRELIAIEIERLDERINRGRDVIASNKDNFDYKRQMQKLNVYRKRLQVCLEILNGEVIIIAELGSQLVVIKRFIEETNSIIAEAIKCGAVVNNNQETPDKCILDGGATYDCIMVKTPSINDCRECEQYIKTQEKLNEL